MEEMAIAQIKEAAICPRTEGVMVVEDHQAPTAGTGVVLIMDMGLSQVQGVILETVQIMVELKVLPMTDTTVLRRPQGRDPDRNEMFVASVLSSHLFMLPFGSSFVSPALLVVSVKLVSLLVIAYSGVVLRIASIVRW